MGRFKKTSKRRKGDNPFNGHLTWNAGRGAFAGSITNPEGESIYGDFSEVKGIILQPFLYMVTGQNRQKTINYSSNLCRHYEYDDLKVKAYFSGSKKKPEVVAEGSWKEVSEASLPQAYPKMNYTRVVVIMLASAKFKEYDPETGKSKKAKSFKFSADNAPIIQLKMRGRSMVDGYAASVNEFDSTKEEADMDGYGFLQSGTVETKGHHEGNTWLQPWFEFQGLPEDSEFFDPSAEAFEKVEEYLQSSWGNPGDDMGDDVEEEEGGEEYSSVSKSEGVGPKGAGKLLF